MSEEGVEIGDRVFETELVNYVLFAVTRIVNLNFIENCRIEPEVEGTSARLLERDVVCQNSNRAGIIRAYKGINVGVIAQCVLGNEWCLSMTRCPADLPSWYHRSHDQQECNRSCNVQPVPLRPHRFCLLCGMNSFLCAGSGSLSPDTHIYERSRCFGFCLQEFFSRFD